MSSSIRDSVLGIVLGYRRGSNRQYVNQVYIKVLTQIENIHSLIGRRVRVSDNYGNTYSGRIIKVHGSGKNRVVIAVFSRNLPGQLIGIEATIF
ncbi:MAG: 50S ribosomal protein L35ae [Sulfolobales archaeon]